MAKLFDMEQRFQNWVKARAPRARETLLNQKRIYIVPSKAGLAMVILFVLLMLLGINFQNNLIYIIAFWLLALLVINILYTYRNLSGLIIRVAHSEPCYAGEKAQFWFELVEKSGRFRPAIQFGWLGEDQITIELQPFQTLQVSLTYPSTKRGWLLPDRLTLLTRFPTGLARAWSYVLPETRAIIYPAPDLKVQLYSSKHNDEEQDSGQEIPLGSNDFSGVRAYQLGDSLKQVHWPQFAKTGQLSSREFVDYQADDQWLDWSHLTLNDTELKLSHLCAKVIEIHRKESSWGLKLPNQTLEISSGDAHKTQSLTALALFGIDDENNH